MSLDAFINVWLIGTCWLLFRGLYRESIGKLSLRPAAVVLGCTLWPLLVALAFIVPVLLFIEGIHEDED